MSFGDLLVLLLFVLFVVLPSIQKAQRRGGGAPGGPVRPGTTRPGRSTPTDAPGDPATASSRDAFPPLEEDELARRLAEARERVRQAAAGAAGPAASTASPSGGRAAPVQDPRARAAAPLVRSPPPGPPAVDPRARARAPLVRSSPTAPAVDPRARARAPLVPGDRDDGLLATPLPPKAALAPRPTPTPRLRPASARDLRAEAPPVEVERLAGRVAPTPAVAALVRLAAASIRPGLRGHPVLGAPRARRRLGGGPSPER